MKSPLHYCGFTDSTIDLSSLAEVSNAYYISHMNFVGFHYRFANTEKAVYWSRELRKLTDLYRYGHSDGERRVAYFEKLGKRAPTLYDETTAEYESDIKPKLFYTEDGQLRCVANLQADVNKLVEAWGAWKAVEPEVYAVIRKHLL